MQNLELIRLKELSLTLWSIIDDLHQAGNYFKTWLNLAESTMRLPKLFCGSMKLKWNNLEGPCSTKSGTAYLDNIIPTLSMMEETFWLGPAQFGVIEGMMNFQVYKKNPEKNVYLSAEMLQTLDETTGQRHKMPAWVHKERPHTNFWTDHIRAETSTL